MNKGSSIPVAQQSPTVQGSAVADQLAVAPIPDGYDPQLYRIRHGLAHVLAQAVLELFPAGKIAIGPPIADGFYYDFDLPRPLTPDDLQAIEKRMKHILKQRHAFAYREGKR